MAIDLNELAEAIGKLTLRFRVRRRTAAAWTSLNEVLLSAELGLESDTDLFKFGDGVTPWNMLAYAGGGGLSLINAGAGISIDFERTGESDGTGDNHADDPYWDDVAIVLHFDGVDHATTTVDSGPHQLAISAIPNGAGVTAYLSTDSPKWGSASSFSNTSFPGWQVVDDDALDLGTDDFLIEYWSKKVGSPSFFEEQTIMAKGTTDGGGIQGWYINSNGGPSIYLWIKTTSGAIVSVPLQGVPVAGAWTTPGWNDDDWNHVAFQRVGPTIHGYVNGIEYATGGTALAPTYGVNIGTDGVARRPEPLFIAHPTYPYYLPFFGLMDDVRITRHSRDPATFPPTGPFPSLGVGATPGVETLKINNIGIITVTAGDGIEVDDTDPRNIIVTATGGGGGGGGTVGPDVPPTSPDTMDDEFNGMSLDSKWTWIQQNSASIAFSYGSMLMTSQITSSNIVNMIEQPLPSGDCVFVLKGAAITPGANNFTMLLNLRETSSEKMLGLGIFNNGGSNIEVIVAAGVLGGGSGDYTSIETVSQSGASGAMSPKIYWKVEFSGSNLIFGVSTDGILYAGGIVFGITDHFTVRPDKIGIGVRASNSSSAAYASVDYFRRIS